MKNKIVSLCLVIIASLFFTTGVFAKPSPITITVPSLPVIATNNDQPDITITSNSVVFTFLPATDNGMSELHYRISITQSGQPVPSANVSQKALTVTITGLSPSTMYAVQITAKDYQNDSAQYPTFQVRTMDPTSYLRLGISSPAYPIYLYQLQSTGALVQTAYIAGSSQRVYLGGSYDNTSSGNYQLYYADPKSPSGYDYCTIGLSNGQVVPSAWPCPGLNNAPGQLPLIVYQNFLYIQPSVYVLNLGAGVASWANAPSAPPQPQTDNYLQQRTITFINNTQYQAIQIAEICTISANPNNPNCVNLDNIAQIAQGASYVFTVDNKAQEGSNYPAGLISFGFYVSAYQKSDGSWVKTGGYSTGHTPYGTKIEGTWLGLTADPNGSGVNWIQNSNLDVSAVDGYNIGVIIYPTFPAYVKSTIGGESTQAEGENIYSQQNPIAQLVPQNNESLESLCNNSSQLPSGQSAGAWPLAVLSDSGDFEGCYSPCRYATINLGKNGITQDEVDAYCCTGNYNTPQTCDAKGLANNSTYVTNMNPPVSQGIYRFAYDDATGDFGFHGLDNIVMSFVSTAPNTITLGSNPAAINITTTSTQLTNYSATDSNSQATVNYTVQLAYAGQPHVAVPNAVINYSSGDIAITGLTANTNYQATVVAYDNSGAVVAFNPVFFTTTQPDPLYFTSASLSGKTYNSATIAFVTSDTPTDEPITYTYAVNGGTPQPFNPNTSPVTIGDLQQSTLYSVVIYAVDQNNNTAKSDPVTFTTPAAPTFTITQLAVSALDPTTVQVNFTGSDSDKNATWQNYSASATSSDGGAVVPPQSISPGGKLVGFTPGKTYTVTVTGVDSDGNNATPATSSQFTMPNYVFTISQPTVAQANVTQTTADVDVQDTYTYPDPPPTSFTITGTSTDGGEQVGPKSIPYGTTTVTGFTPGATYTVIVSGVDSLGNKATSPASGQFTMLPYTVTAPTGVSGTETGQTTATISWTGQSEDQPSNSAQQMTYVATATPIPGQQSTQVVTSNPSAVNASSLDMTGLAAGTTYTVTVVGTDQDNNVSPASAASDQFTTAPQTYTVTAPTGVSGTETGQTTATISWTGQSEDQPSNSAQQMTYVATATPIPGQQSTQVVTSNPSAVNASSLDMTGLAAGTTYTVTVVGTDQDNNVSPASAASAQFTTQAAALPSLSVTYDGNGIVAWSKDEVPPTGNDCGNITNAQAIPVGGGTSVSGAILCKEREQLLRAEFPVSSLVAGETYVMQIDINGQQYQSNSFTP